MKRECKILKKYLDERNIETYELSCPDFDKPKLYKKNPGRQCLVGREFISADDPDIYTFEEGYGDTITLTPIPLILDLDSNGYYQMNHKNYKGEDDKDWIHRVIAYSWLPNFNLEKDQIDHIDRNKLNNHLSNLRAISPFSNALKEFKNGNPKGREYLIESLQTKLRTKSGDVYKISSYTDLENGMIESLEGSGYLVINELPRDYTENQIAMLRYIVDRYDRDNRH